MDAEPGVDPHQVAEVIATGADGTGRRASGYRVTSGVVLTAAHAVTDARTVRVRFDADTPGEWSAPALDVVADPASDLAAVRIDAPDDLPVCAFGRIGDGPGVVDVEAVGFPRFKLKEYPDPRSGRYRDSHHAVGTVAPLSNRRSRRLEVSIPPPERDPDPHASPWEGMSGAALWAGRHIVGVVTDHHRSDGLGRLAAARVTELLDGAAGDAARRLKELLGLPPRLDDVAGPKEASYRRQIRDIAPDELLGREEELRALAGFAEPYGRWEGLPWAGKTALMAWFALHPPPDVHVVAYFAGAGGATFLDAVSEQLAVLAGRPAAAPATSADLRRGLLELIDAAAERCRDAGRRIVLVVDGLDEDTGPATQECSIAALLPRRPPPDTTVLVTSRPDHPLPRDVPADHPLHGCARHRLPVSPHAHDVELFAQSELAKQLRESPLHEDLIGLITASGGGLTRDDLAELSGVSPFAVADLLSGAFGRSVATRANRGYVLAHRALRDAACRELGSHLDKHRARLADWCEDHRLRCWPAGTPAYLLHDYPRALAAAGDVKRLAALASDPVRHERLLEVTGGDAAALDEIALAQRLGAEEREPDLMVATLLAMRREDLADRNKRIPVRLPAVWAALGRRDRAAALAQGFPKRKRRAAALAAAACAAACAGHLDDAEVLAERVPDEDRQDSALATMAVAAAAHDPDRALRWARNCSPERRTGALARVATALADRDRRRSRAVVAELAASPLGPGARVTVAVAAVAVGEPDLADALVAGIPRGGFRNRALAEVAVALADADEASRAEKIAQTVRRPGLRLPVLAALVRSAVRRGDAAAARRHLGSLSDAAGAAPRSGEVLVDLIALARAVADPAVTAELLRAAERLVTDRVDRDQLDWARGRLAVAHASVGGTERSEELLDLLPDGDRTAGALAEIAAQAARGGHGDRAEAVVRRVPGDGRRMRALVDVAAALTGGDPRRAEAIAAEAESMARRTSDPHRFATMAAPVVDGLVALGEVEAALEVAERIAEPSARDGALGRVATALATTGAVEDAIDLARALGEAEHRSWALVGVCEAQAARGDRDGASATAAAVVAEPPGDGYPRVVAFLLLSAALHAVGAVDDAGRLRTAATRQAVDDVPDPGQRARAVAQLAVTLAAADDAVRAAVLARRTGAMLAGIDDRQRQDRARTRVVEVFATAGRTTWADDIARSIVAPASRVRALAALGTAMAGDPDRAWTLLSRAEESLPAIESAPDRETATGRIATAATVLLAAGTAPAHDRRAWITRVVAELLGTAGWVDAVPALARLDRAAFDVLARWLAEHTTS